MKQYKQKLAYFARPFVKWAKQNTRPVARWAMLYCDNTDDLSPQVGSWFYKQEKTAQEKMMEDYHQTLQSLGISEDDPGDWELQVSDRFVSITNSMDTYLWEIKPIVAEE